MEARKARKDGSATQRKVGNQESLHERKKEKWKERIHDGSTERLYEEREGGKDGKGACLKEGRKQEREKERKVVKG